MADPPHDAQVYSTMLDRLEAEGRGLTSPWVETPGPSPLEPDHIAKVARFVDMCRPTAEQSLLYGQGEAWFSACITTGLIILGYRHFVERRPARVIDGIVLADLYAPAGPRGAAAPDAQVQGAAVPAAVIAAAIARFEASVRALQVGRAAGSNVVPLGGRNLLTVAATLWRIRVRQMTEAIEAARP